MEGFKRRIYGRKAHIQVLLTFSNQHRETPVGVVPSRMRGVCLCLFAFGVTQGTKGVVIELIGDIAPLTSMSSSSSSLTSQ